MGFNLLDGSAKCGRAWSRRVRRDATPEVSLRIRLCHLATVASPALGEGSCPLVVERSRVCTEFRCKLPYRRAVVSPAALALRT